MFLDVLYQIIINPIYILIEVLYNFFLKTCSFNQNFSIIALSIVLNFIWLPLYLNADKLKFEHDEIQKKLKKKIDSIKKNFKGEERHMLLSTYYKQNNYHPIFALRSTLSLALQAVFFIGAYLFFIKNVPSSPDGLLKISELKINILPILMTFINLLAGLIYAKKHNQKTLQIWVLAFLFLILLYNAPQTLVLYWIFNNLFSLVKNIILNCDFKESFIKKPAVLDKFIGFIKKLNTDKTNLKSCYFLLCVCLWLLVGFLIPWNLIASAPVKFFYIYPYYTPFPILFQNLVQVFGIFVFWTWVIWVFSQEKYKSVITSILAFLFFGFLINYTTIEYPYGEVTNALEFTHYIGSKTLPLYCYLISILTFVILVYLLLKNRKIINKILIIFIISTFIMGVYDAREIISIEKKIPEQKREFEPVYNFSKTQKNVLIIFIDKAIGNLLPVIFNEKPSLKKDFDGFTYYPNIVSYAVFTRLAYPAMIGGWEYTPLNLDKNRQKPMLEKYNESLLMLPTLFKNNGFETTVTDAPWGNYEYITPKELFLDKGINYDNIAGNYSELYKEKYNFSKDLSSLYALKRNILYFAFMKVAPVSLRDFIIDENNYLNLKKEEIKFTNDLLAHYSLMYYLPNITTFNAKKPTFTIINSELTHNADCFLTYPNYELTFKPKKGSPIKADRYSQIHYHSNASGIRLIASYLKFLKEQGIYDNTRIIIVSDHGCKRFQNPYIDEKIRDNVVRFNPLLLVKDFNQKGEIKTDNTFMTNANTPYIATKDVIKNPVNPFTGNKIEIPKDSIHYLVTRTKRFKLKDKAQSPFNYKTQCVTIKEDIFKAQNWKNVNRKKLNKILKENKEGKLGE